MIDTLYLHIGLEKTGSTTLQHFLASNALELKQNGWLIPEVTQTSGPNHTAVAAYALDDDSSDSATLARARLMEKGASLGEYRRQLELQLRGEIEAAGPIHSMIISSEDLSRLFTQAEIERLRAFLFRLARKVVVVVILRRQDLLASSRFSTLLLGRRPQAKVFQYPEQGVLRFYDFESNIGRWIDSFGLENIRVLLYPDTQAAPRFDTVERFCQVVGLSGLNTTPVSVRNVSMDAVAQIILRGYVDAGLSNEVSMAELANRYRPTGAREGRHIVTRRMAVEFYDKYADANERLFERLGMAGQGFSRDFSMYPSEKELLGYYRAAMRRSIAVQASGESRN